MIFGVYVFLQYIPNIKYHHEKWWAQMNGEVSASLANGERAILMTPNDQTQLELLRAQEELQSLKALIGMFDPTNFWIEENCN